MPVDGDVIEVKVKDRDVVKKDDLLVKLRNTDLEVKFQDVVGQIQVKRSRLFSVERSLFEQKNRSDVRNRDEVERIRLQGEAEELEHELQTLDEQYQLLRKKREMLEIRSPIDGEVMMSWDVQKSLMYRPVTTGQMLLSVADPKGDWELELYMRESRGGHVRRARADEDLQKRYPGAGERVTYVLATDPGTQRNGKVTEVKESTEIHQDEGNIVKVKVAIDRGETRRSASRRHGDRRRLLRAEVAGLRLVPRSLGVAADSRLFLPHVTKAAAEFGRRDGAVRRTVVRRGQRECKTMCVTTLLIANLLLAAQPAGAVRQLGSSSTLRLPNCLVSLIDDVDLPAQEAGVLQELIAKGGCWPRRETCWARSTKRRRLVRQKAAKFKLDVAIEKATNDGAGGGGSEKIIEVYKAEYEESLAINETSAGAIPPTQLRRQRVYCARKAWPKHIAAEMDFKIAGLERKVQEAEVGSGGQRIEATHVGGAVRRRGRGDLPPAERMGPARRCRCCGSSA